MKEFSLTKCAGTDCSKASMCYRFTKEPLQKYQSWLIMCVSVKDTEICRFFYPIPSEEG